jgi:hypothetical protein
VRNNIKEKKLFPLFICVWYLFIITCEHHILKKTNN